ncbi:spectrin alpha chain, non-erythrocytic 1-like [Anoplophora glabripennis]|uniref:spectrin alpha chain, non-erythrocytic 1-like n=1 Tax=Anoplophora glabripennis TaxID=217634 RepID=UPI000C774CD0|nr:spectrin alpha chain, non-erythrocytic 1-like [Anoplophora glabripennis]
MLETRSIRGMPDPSWSNYGVKVSPHQMAIPIRQGKTGQDDICYVVAKYDYEHQGPQELDLKKNERYVLLDDTKHWWKVQNSRGQAGYVPSNYVKKEKPSLFDSIKKKVATVLEDKIDILLREIRAIKVEMESVKEIRTEVKQIRKEMKEYKEEIYQLRKENGNLKKECETIKQENEEMKKEIKLTKNRVDNLEKYAKENNVIITGMIIDTDDAKALKETMANFLEMKLNVEVKLKRVRKLGQKTCLMELSSEEDKKMVMENKSKLRNLKNERIYINDDLTKSEIEMRKMIREKAEEERANGKTIKIGYKKLIVDGKVWRWNQNEERLEEVNKRK